MWNDEEDNNPYGTSFDRRDSITSSSANPTSPTPQDCKSLLMVFLRPHPVVNFYFPWLRLHDVALDSVPGSAQ